MGAVTYPDPKVQQAIAQDFVPIRYNVGENPEAFQQFNASWTPTIIIQDSEGREARRSEGYLDPARFLAELALARVKAALLRQDYDAARRLADEAISAAAGDKQREPEALYWQAVVAYRLSGSGGDLVTGWTRLLNEFPDSEWSRRAEFIRRPQEASRAA
jgi:hypothetical protein